MRFNAKMGYVDGRKTGHSSGKREQDGFSPKVNEIGEMNRTSQSSKERTRGGRRERECWKVITVGTLMSDSIRYTAGMRQ